MMLNGYSASDIHHFLHQAWGELCPNIQTVYRVMADFQSGKRLSLGDAARSGRPTSVTTENVDKVKSLVDENPEFS